MNKMFALRGATGPLFHGAHSLAPLEFLGRFTVQGPQPVSDDGGVPRWVADLFESMPHLKQIALNGDSSGVVWSRIEA